MCMQVPAEARENWMHLELELKAVMSHPPSMDAENKTLVLCRNSIHSEPLNYLSSPPPNFHLGG